MNLVVYQANKPDQFMHRYAYDADNRITQVETSSDGVLWDKDAKYFYYDHGPLARTETGDLKVQGMDYAYTIMGWIKGVNSNALAATTDIGNDGLTGSLNAKIGSDAFGYSLNYFVNDYKAIATLNPANNFIAGTANIASVTGAGNDGKSLYNGNISSMVTTIIDPDNISTPLPQLTAYKYDQLNRITKLDAYRNINLATNSWTSAATDNTYQERYSYDANGNIKTLSRNGNLGGALEMDRFEYHYEGPAVDVSFKKKNNRLSWVTDNGSATGAYNTDLENQGTKNYSYDEIGNLKQDNQEEIAEIKWTVSGKISEVIRTASSNKSNLEFRYDAAGNRMMKIVKPKSSLTNPTGWTKTYYVRDATGTVMSTYEEVPTINQGHYSLSEQHIYGSSRMGMRSINKDLISLDIPTPNTYARILGEKRYEGSNHLGNVLAVFSDRRKGVDFSKPNLLQSSDYYAFGMAMPGRTFTGSDGYRYGFNGMERENEAGSFDYDFGARIYDSRIARWLAMDPLTWKYPDMSSYTGMGNSPIVLKDINGKDIYIFIFASADTESGAAHVAFAIGQNTTALTYYSLYRKGDGGNIKVENLSYEQAKVYDINVLKHQTHLPVLVIKITTSIETDKEMNTVATSDVNSRWLLMTNNCADGVKDALDAAGISEGCTFFISTPNEVVEDLVENNKKLWESGVIQVIEGDLKAYLESEPNGVSQTLFGKDEEVVITGALPEPTVTNSEIPISTTSTKIQVQIGAFKSEKNAQQRATQFGGVIKSEGGLYKVIVETSTTDEAQKVIENVSKVGDKAFIRKNE